MMFLHHCYASSGILENSLDGAIHTDLMYERPYDYNFTGDVLTLDQTGKYDLSVLERGLPQVYPVKSLPEDKMQYLQVRGGGWDRSGRGSGSLFACNLQQSHIPICPTAPVFTLGQIRDL